jgi:HEAT repeat protein
MMRSRLVFLAAAAVSFSAGLPSAGCSAPGMLLISQDEGVRESALQELESKSPEEKAKAVPALVSALNNPKAVVRRLAADALAKIGPAAKDAVPALTGSLRDEDVEVRYRAIRALGNIGPAASSAVPGLIEALKTTYGGIGVVLARTDGGKLTGEPIPGRPAELAGFGRGDLIAAVDDRPTDGLSNADAAELLRGLPGTRVKITLRPAAAGTEASRDIVVVRGEIPSTAVCRAAAEALGKIGPAASAALPALKEAENESIERIRTAAQNAAQRIEGGAPRKD